MKAISFLVILFSFTVQLYGQSPVKTHQVGDVKLHWQFDGDQLFVTLFSPTKGWLGIGFNDKNVQEGTNMYKAHVKRNSVRVADHFQQADQSYKLVGEIGGQSHVSNVQGMEGSRGTTVMFSIATSPKDELHYLLQNNKEIFVTFAYSKKDDFNSKAIFTETIPFRL